MPSRPVISIVGSVNPGRRYEPPLRNPDTAHQACEELGKELALSCDLLVYSGSGEFIEADVVRGFIASNAATPASIHVRSPSDATAVFAEYDRHKELFDPRIDSSPDWEVSFYRSLVESHGLIIIGGGRSTLITGLIALTFRIPLVAVRTFGGNAEKVWEALERIANDTSPQEVTAMAQPWHHGSASELVSSLLSQRQRALDREEDERRKRLLRSRTATVGVLSAALLLIAAVATVPLNFVWTPGAAGTLVLLTVAPLLAGASGALIRNSLDEGRHWIRPAVLGLAAGTVSFLLFVAAQLATSPDALNEQNAWRLLFFVIPVGFIAGLTFDAVYVKLQAADVTPTSVLGPKGT